MNGSTPVMDAFVDFVLGLELASLSSDVVEAASRSLTDWLGAALRGAGEPLADAISAVIDATGGDAHATVVGRRRRTSALLAALANGAQSHALDFDDTHLGAIVHGSSPVAPVVLALGEWRHRSGAEALTAFIAGFEVETRIGRVIGRRLMDRGWHVTANLGHFGAAAAAGRLLGLDAGRLAHALGIAGTQAAGLAASFGTMAKPMHPGKAAMNGLLAALLAREGFTGATGILDGPGSFPDTFVGVTDLGPAVEDFGKRYELLENSTKFYAACHLTHATIDAARAIRARWSPPAEAVVAVDCRVHPLVLKVANQRDPRTDLEAKFSVAFCAAMALVRGAAGESEFSTSSLADRDVRRLIPRVTADADHTLDIAAAHVTVRLSDGRVLAEEVRAARGTPANPGTREDIDEKFRRLAGVRVAADRVERLLVMLRDLGRVPDVAEVATLAAG